LTALIFSFTLNIKEFEPLLLPFAALAVLLGTIPKNYVEEVYVYRQAFLLKRSWMIFVILPLLLWLISLIKEKRQNEKQGT
jgi:spore germination protein KB